MTSVINDDYENADDFFSNKNMLEKAEIEKDLDKEDEKEAEKFDIKLLQPKNEVK